MIDKQVLGLDFGTTNTALATIDAGVPRRLELEGEHLTIPSAVFYAAFENERAYGRDAFGRYLAGDDGRLLRGLKTVLGTSLASERTAAGGQLRTFSDIIEALFVHVFRAVSERREDCTLVVGRPVHFGHPDVAQRDDPEAFLRAILERLGFCDISFLYEPLAAALAHERTARREELALVVDIGGGTSDFSVIRTSVDRSSRVDNANDVLANSGIRIGGDRLDEKFSLAVAMPQLGYGSRLKGTEREQPGRIWFDLVTWHRINALYNKKTVAEIRMMLLDAAEPERVQHLLTSVEARRGHAIAASVEQAKARLSDATVTALTLDVGKPPLLEIDVDRASLEEAVASEIERVRECALIAISDAGVQCDDIQALFYTGGSSLLPLLRQRIGSLFPNARTVQENAFGSVAEGLAIEASRRAHN